MLVVVVVVVVVACLLDLRGEGCSDICMYTWIRMLRVCFRIRTVGVGVGVVVHLPTHMYGGTPCLFSVLEGFLQGIALYVRVDTYKYT